MYWNSEKKVKLRIKIRTFIQIFTKQKFVPIKFLVFTKYAYTEYITTCKFFTHTERLFSEPRWGVGKTTEVQKTIEFSASHQKDVRTTTHRKMLHKLSEILNYLVVWKYQELRTVPHWVNEWPLEDTARHSFRLAKKSDEHLLWLLLRLCEPCVPSIVSSTQVSQKIARTSARC